MPLSTIEGTTVTFGVNRPPVNIARVKRVIPVVLNSRVDESTKWNEDYTLDNLDEIPGIDMEENDYWMVLTYFGSSGGTDRNIHETKDIGMRINLFPPDSTLKPRNSTATANIHSNGTNPLAAIFTWHVRSFSALPTGSMTLTGTSVPFLLNHYPGESFFSGRFKLNIQLRRTDQFAFQTTQTIGARIFTTVFQIYEIPKR